jgi:hypothetical protein
MFTVEIKKGFGNHEAMSYEVNNKAEFTTIISKLYDTMEENIKAEHNFDILEKIESMMGSKFGFENEDDFWSWLNDMRCHDLLTPEFNWDDLKEEIIAEAVSDLTDYSDLNEINDKLEEYSNAIEDIYDICKNVR